VVIEWTSRALTANGDPYENHCIGVFTVAHGKIVAVRECMDTGYAQRQFRAPVGNQPPGHRNKKLDPPPRRLLLIHADIRRIQPRFLLAARGVSDETRGPQTRCRYTRPPGHAGARRELRSSHGQSASASSLGFRT
jgi:hypothetical protein